MPRRPIEPVLCLALLIAAALSSVGCEAPGFIAYAVAGPPKVKAKYTLPAAPTLVVVDDPRQQLGDLNYPTVVGANVTYHLQENGKLTPEQIVSQDRLTVLVSQMGERYAATPIDQIGQRLKARQVIHVFVRSVNLQSRNTYYEPTAEVEVKVIDAQTGARLFPTQLPDAPTQSAAPGHTLLVKMKRQTLDETRRHALPMLGRSLAERVGLEVAQLFYDHVPPDANELGQ